MARTRIKICGVRDVESAMVAAECGADAIGLVFVERSPRRVTVEEAWGIGACLPPFVTRVGLFVNSSAEEIEAARAEAGLELVQLHGDEDEALARAVGPGVIKALRFDAATIEAEIRRWNAVDEVDALLIDGGAGGEGVTLDWDSLARVREACDHPIILAGGLTAVNVRRAIEVVRPWAVDVSSGVERPRGRKDARLIAGFCEAVREAD